MKPIIETVRSGARPGTAGRLARLPALLLLAILPGAAHAVEEPAYTVLQTFPTFEIRQYVPYTVAEVLMPPPVTQQAGSEGLLVQFVLPEDIKLQEPVLSRYNGPMTPWFMRRNEIWLNLD